MKRPARQPATAPDIAPAITHSDASPEVWSCIDKTITVSISVRDETGNETFLSSQISRPTDEIIRIELRSSHERAPMPEPWGHFFVPIALAPFLGDYFAAMVRRMQAAVMLVPDSATHTEVEAVRLPVVAA